MSALKQAMYKLDRSIGRLEHSVRGLEKSMAGQQRDMFAQPAPGKPDTAKMSARLDRAIERVEAILQDA